MPSTPDIDASALAEALNEKLDRDGYNATNDIKEMMANMGMPSGQYVDITLGANGSTYTAPADGWLVFKYSIDTATGAYVNLFNRSTQMTSHDNNDFGWAIEALLPCSKGDIIQYNYYKNSGNWHDLLFRFHYANGSQHLASN